MIKKGIIYLRFLFLVMIISSCGNVDIFSMKKHNIKSSRVSSIVDKPRYRDNGGEIKTNFLNKQRVEKERINIQTNRLILTLIDTLKPVTPKNGAEPVSISKLEQIRLECYNKINLLYEELKTINPNTKDGYKRSLEMQVEINDLYANIIQPLNKISNNIKVKELQGDFSFKTGSHKLTESGQKDIELLVQSIEYDLIEWKKYVNNFNQQIFSNEVFKLMVVIDGYADKQGSNETNLILSEKRAEEVKNYFEKMLNPLSKKYKVIFDLNAFGKGEELPPGIEDNGKETDHRRRICRIMSVVGPKSFME